MEREEVGRRPSASPARRHVDASNDDEQPEPETVKHVTWQASSAFHVSAGHPSGAYSPRVLYSSRGRADLVERCPSPLRRARAPS